MITQYRLRHPFNTKLRYYFDELYRGYDIMQDQEEPQIENYLERLFHVLIQAQKGNRITFAFRVDLRYPKHMPMNLPRNENGDMQRFLRFFFYELKISNTKYCPTPRFVWAREQVAGDMPHYHIMFLLNKDAHDSLGKLSPDNEGIYSYQNLYHRMMRSWLKAIGLGADETRFPQLINVTVDREKKVIWSRQLHIDDWNAMNEAMYMGSYLCKSYSKPIGKNVHVFESSRR